MTTPKRTWFPRPSQLFIGDKNKFYAQSVFVGITVPIFHLPSMCWHALVVPVWDGLKAIGRFFLTSVTAGFAGRAHGFLVDKPTDVITINVDE